MAQTSILPFFQPSSLQPTTFVPQRTAFVPQTTNQEHTPITSNYTRKPAFMATQNNQKIFVPGKRNLEFFLLKNPHHGLPSPVSGRPSMPSPEPGTQSSTVYPASCILHRPRSILNVQTSKRFHLQPIAFDPRKS
jgi:hypothetical protein